MSSRLRERPWLKKQGWEWLRKTNDTDLWPPHAYTCTHTCIHTWIHTHRCHVFFYVGSFLVVVMLSSNLVWGAHPCSGELWQPWRRKLCGTPVQAVGSIAELPPATKGDSHHDRICGKNTQSTLRLFSPDEYAVQYSGVCGGGRGGPKWAMVILSKQSSALFNEQALGSWVNHLGKSLYLSGSQLFIWEIETLCLIATGFQAPEGRVLWARP